MTQPSPCSPPEPSPTLAAMLAVLRAPDLHCWVDCGQIFLRSSRLGILINPTSWYLMVIGGATYYPLMVLDDRESVVWRDACQAALCRLTLPHFEELAKRVPAEARA